ncbi:MAG TPA: thioredoxin family protein [Sphingobium sp.]|uniref:protein-disulfide reductase DsbD family protein n=1 Tax=Sphingobium sp. TaxID=1912891 RepID=UPI002ED4D1FA
MRFPNFLFVTLALIAALFSSGSLASAQGLPGGDGPHIHPQLIAESRDPAPGSTVMLAIVMRPSPGWHGYWVNPGDAGLDMDARWTLPTGANVGDLRYPAPERLLVSGLMNHVFKGPYALLAELRVPPQLKVGQPLPIVLDAHWLACTDKVCVPEKAKLSLDLVVGAGSVSADSRSRFDDYRAALPRPLGSEAHYAVTGDRIRIAIPYPATAPVENPWFYAVTKDRITYAEPQQAGRSGDMLVLETKLSTKEPFTGPLQGVLTVASGTSLSLTASQGVVPVAAKLLQSGSEQNGAFSASAFFLALGGALLGGLLLNIMPCVFPILSLKAISLARAGGNEREARAEALAYTAGTLLSCMALGGVILALRAAGTSVGWAFQLQDNRVIALLLVLTVAITANLAGAFALPALDGGRQDKGARGAFFTGVLAAFVATPCTGPFMAAAMGAAILMPAPLALAIFAGLGLGLASPFLALSFIPALRRRLPKPGMWMEWLRRSMAVPMALTVLALGWLLWRQGGEAAVRLALGLSIVTLLLCVFIGRWQRGGRRVLVPALGGTLLLFGVAIWGAMHLQPRQEAGVEGAFPFDQARLAQLRASGRPVFLYFTADWCLTCKVNEAGAIANADVAKAFAAANVAVMAGDWTKGDPVITRFLEEQGRSGVPLYLYYAPGMEKPQLLPQILTPATLTALAKD